MEKIFKKNKRFGMFNSPTKRMPFNRGITLIEVLTVVSVMVILSAITFGNYKGGNDSLALDRAAQKLAQDFRRVNEKAASGFDSGTYFSYGIYFNTSTNQEQYLIYGNKSNDGGDKGYDPNNPDPSKRDVSIETVVIEKGIKICSIKEIDLSVTPNTETTVGSRSVCFVPPRPTVFMDENGSELEVSIVLAPEAETNCAAPAKSKTIKVNSIGRVDVIN